MKRLIHTCFILFKGKISSLFCFWPDGPHEHLLCTLSALLELQRLGAVFDSKWFGGGTSVLNGFGASKLILVDPLHTEPPFQSCEPPRLLCSNEKERERQITENRNKKKGMKGRKEALKPFISFEFFKCVIFGEGGCMKSQLEVFLF